MKDGKNTQRDRSVSHVIAAERKELSKNSSMPVFRVRMIGKRLTYGGGAVGRTIMQSQQAFVKPDNSELGKYTGTIT